MVFFRDGRAAARYEFRSDSANPLRRSEGMNRSAALSLGLMIVTKFAVCGAVAIAADAPSTRPTTRPLPEVFRVGLVERKLEIAIVPREPAAGPTSRQADADSAEATTASFEFNTSADERWLVQA